MAANPPRAATIATTAATTALAAAAPIANPPASAGHRGRADFGRQTMTNAPTASALPSNGNVFSDVAVATPIASPVNNDRQTGRRTRTKAAIAAIHANAHSVSARNCPAMRW